MEKEILSILISNAARYETANFLTADPSKYMHNVEGSANKEVTAFVASCLSYGNRKQFMQNIQLLLDYANNDMYNWILSKEYQKDIPDDKDTCFYRLYTMQTMRRLLDAIRMLLQDNGSIGCFIQSQANDGLAAINAITSFFAAQGIDTIIPQNTKSACKRICMFLRWMVRDNSPVDLGLWADIIDKRTLIMPVDTHVLQEANSLGLIHNKTASMSVAKRLTKCMAEIFPDDPLKGDFALFGYGVTH